MLQMPMSDKTVIHSPHVVLLGAGASLASFQEGDANRKTLPLMKNLIEIVKLNEILSQKNIEFENQNFEEIYNDLYEQKGTGSIIEEIENKIHDYFDKLKIPDEPTIYDYLILSLREKDVIATFNWDPLLLQAYARISITKRLPRLLFLHGNVGMGVCKKDKVVGHIRNKCSKCKNPLDSIKLLYPIKTKNYSSDPVIKAQWDELRHNLKHAYMFTIFGYSAPVTDVDAKELMLGVWKKNKSFRLAQIEIINRGSREKIENNWKDFTFSHHYDVRNNFFDSFLAKFPRRSCEMFFQSNLMARFVNQNEFPRFEKISDLHNWIKPLLDEEEKYEKHNIPFKIDVE